MLSSFLYPLPPANTDRLAAIRAVKVAFLNGQQTLGPAQQQFQRYRDGRRHLLVSEQADLVVAVGGAVK